MEIVLLSTGCTHACRVCKVLAPSRSMARTARAPCDSHNLTRGGSGSSGRGAPRDVLQRLVHQDDGEGQPQDGAPLGRAQRGDAEQQRKRRHVQDRAVQRHGQPDRAQQPRVAPGRQLRPRCPQLLPPCCSGLVGRCNRAAAAEHTAQVSPAALAAAGQATAAACQGAQSHRGNPQPAALPARAKVPPVAPAKASGSSRVRRIPAAHSAPAAPHGQRAGRGARMQRVRPAHPTHTAARSLNARRKRRRLTHRRKYFYRLAQRA